MIFDWPNDFNLEGTGETPEQLSGAFRSNLPTFNFLKDTVLDPALDPQVQGVDPQAWAQLEGIPIDLDAYRRRLTELASIDNLQVGRRVFWDEGKLGGAGVLSTNFSVYQNLFQAINPVGMGTLDGFTLQSQMATQWVGQIGNFLASVPNIYAQIAGAVMGLIAQVAGIANMLSRPDPPKALLGVIPAQEPTQDTDLGLFNVNIRGTLSPGIGQSLDYTSLFGPRYLGDPTFQYRKNEAGQEVVAFGLGNGSVGENPGAFDNGVTGFTGMIPGARQITSLFQGTFLQTPEQLSFGDHRYQHKLNLYCADFTGGEGGHQPPLGNIAPVQDVGSWYTTSGNALLALWTHMNRVSPVMYTVNFESLETAWHDYFEAMYDLLKFAWGRSQFENKWGAGAWRCMLVSLYQRLVVSTVSTDSGQVTRTIAGNMKAPNVPGMPNVESDTLRPLWAPPTAQAQSDPFRWWWDRVNIFEAIIKPSLREMAMRQAYYLAHTTVAAYVRPDFGAFKSSGMNDLLTQHRQRVLTTNARYDVRERDVTDEGYRQLLEDAGSFEFPIKAPGQGAVPEVPPDAPPPPGGGSGWEPVGGIAFAPPPDPVEEEEETFLQKHGAKLAGGAVLALGAYAWSRRKA